MDRQCDLFMHQAGCLIGKQSETIRNSVSSSVTCHLSIGRLAAIGQSICIKKW